MLLVAGGGVLTRMAGPSNVHAEAKPDAAFVAPTGSDREAVNLARQYYLRDRDALKVVFQGGFTGAPTRQELRQKFDIEESSNADELALVLACETRELEADLSRLAEEYVELLDAALERTLAASPTFLEDGSDVIDREPDEAHRILVDQHGLVRVFRLKLDDQEQARRLFEKAASLATAREARMLETLETITGRKHSRRGIAALSEALGNPRKLE